MAKRVGKSRGKHGIVIGAMMEEWVILHCSRVLKFGSREALDDYHRDMDSVVFEEQLQTSIPLTQSLANARHVTIIMDNTPHHSRVIEKVIIALLYLATDSHEEMLADTIGIRRPYRMQ
ncbi:hypothetical protein Aduo_018783 [Ancylostoma duodenale]